ncbi:TrbI/VirB10 family protein [Leclercia sp. Marseille-Q4284]|uniref:TrbI/VirB10 family protein n=1 Tax=Leclercia sp. Marseille-Q4284 TaxID=2866582 RepID=UPI001CE41652|nr:TrbI/VirB10 family protein [Leclercia sp. Marseille-Q4284]
MEERQNRVDEKPSTYKKKGQFYLMIAFGLVGLLLFINMIYNISTSTKKSTAEESKPAAAPAVNNDPDRFNQLVDNQRARQQKEQVKEPPKSPYDIQLSGKNTADGGAEAKNGNDNSNSPSISEDEKRKQKLINEVKARFEAQEVERALKARQTRYEDSNKSVPGAGRNSSSASSHRSSGSGGSNSDRIADIDSQRSALQTRIRMMEAQQDKSGDEVAQKMASARSNVDAQMRDAGKGVSSTGGARSFGGGGGSSKGPTDEEGNAVVGYPADNRYKASTEGKIKLPTGAEINAITTYTAVSDFVGGSMKAMVTNDVMDASNSYILAPKGSTLMIKAVGESGVNQPIQNKMAFLVTWLVLPNGDRIDFSKQSVLDRMGSSGVAADEVDYHITAQILGVAAYALIGTKTSYEGTGDSKESLAGNFGSGARQQASGQAQKFLNIVPTKTLHAGQPIRILVEDEMYITPWKTLYENYVD